MTHAEYRRRGSLLDLRDATEELDQLVRVAITGVVAGEVYKGWVAALAVAVRDGALSEERAKKWRAYMASRLKVSVDASEHLMKAVKREVGE